MKSYSKANYASATEMLKNGDRSKAKKLFELILDSDPNHAAANYEMGLLTADDQKTQSSLMSKTGSLRKKMRKVIHHKYKTNDISNIFKTLIYL